MLDDIYSNMDIVSDAVLKVKDDDDNSSVDIVDLFDNTLCEYVEFKLEKRAALEFQYASRLMKMCIRDRWYHTRRSHRL